MKYPWLAKSTILTMSLAMITLSGVSQAGGGGSGVGNGGNAVVLPDDTVILGDVYTTTAPDTEVSTFLDFHPSIQAELERVSFFLVRLGAAVDDTVPQPLKAEVAAGLVKSRYLSRTAESKFVLDLVKHPLIEYRFAETLPHNCHSVHDDVHGLPGTATLVAAACTEGPVTWIQKSIFARMSVREQAKLIIHERMHALMANFPHEFISDMTVGLETMLSLYNLQIAGQRPMLTRLQVNQLTLMIKRLWGMGLSAGRPETDMEFLTNWRILPNGGGLAHKNSKVSPYAYVGIASLLGQGSEMEDRSEMIGSSCYTGVCNLAEGVSVVDSTFALTASAGILHDPAAESFRVHLGAGAKVSSSQLLVSLAQVRGSDFDLGPNSRIEMSSISGFQHLILQENAFIDHYAISVASRGKAVPGLLVESGASLSNGFAFLLASAPIHRQRDLLISVPNASKVDFRQSASCPMGQFVNLQEPLTLRTPEELKSLCLSVPPRL